MSPQVCALASDPAAGWMEHARGAREAAVAEDTVHQVYPRDAVQTQGADARGGFKAHWRWGGVVVAVPWAVLERANGFPEDASLALHVQIEHFRDRAAIFKVAPVLAPGALAVRRLYGDACCTMEEVAPAALQEDGPGFPMEADETLQLLEDMRTRVRSPLAVPGIL